MNNILVAYAQENFHESVVGQFQQAAALMEEYNVTEFQDDLMGLVARMESYEPLELSDLFYTRVYTYVKQVIEAHDIRLDDEAELSVLLQIADGIKNLETWQDHDGIVNVLNGPANPEETLAVLLNMVTLLGQGQVALSVPNVSVSFLEKLEEIHSQESDKADTEAEHNFELIAQLKLVKEYINYDEALGFKMVRSGYRLGAPIQYYLDRLKKHTELLEDKQVSKELFVLLFMASDTYQDYSIVISELLGKLYDDLNRISAVNTQLKTLLSGFVQFKLAKDQARRTA